MEAPVRDVIQLPQRKANITDKRNSFASSRYFPAYFIFQVFGALDVEHGVVEPSRIGQCLRRAGPYRSVTQCDIEAMHL